MSSAVALSTAARPAAPPHGGVLVDLRVGAARAIELASITAHLPAWELSRRQRCDLELLATGGFSPLRTFLGRADYESVCAAMRLRTGELWPIPVTLDVPESVVEAASAAGGLVLRARGRNVAVMWWQSAWRPDLQAEASAVFGTLDPVHPGVHTLLRHTHPWYVSGPLEVLALPRHYAFRTLRHTPAEVRSLLAERGWERVVAFQTRNPMHRAHQELTLRAARQLGAKLLLHPVVGMTKPGDVDPSVRVRCYRALLQTYPPGTALLSVTPLAMRMAGPREALWHAIVRKNHGATHFIVGRDHAGPGMDLEGRPFYQPHASQELALAHERELDIGIVPFKRLVYVEELQAYLPDDEVQPGHHRLNISGTEQRRRLSRGEDLPPWFTPPEVAAELRRGFPSPSERGIGIVLHAELARPEEAAAAIAARLREAGRRVTVLDGAPAPRHAETAGLAVDLIGGIMRNGGAVVCTREAAVYVGQAASRLLPCGLLLDVGNPDGDDVPCVTDAGGRDGVVRLRVDPSAEVDAVTEAVWGALEELRCLRPGTAAADPVGAP